MPYNVHAVIGKQKGKFIKQKVKQNIHAMVERLKGKVGRRINSNFIKNEVSICDICLRYK